jgi:phosphoribosylaminoimidazole-succinocarboxamide synthase
MNVKAAKAFGKGVEFICRYRAVGSFIRRYGAYAVEGDKLDAYVEATLKDDERGDPLITAEGLEVLGIMSKDQYRYIEKSTQDITALISELLEGKGLELYDIKLEFGLDKYNDIMLIDEISSGNMRVYKGENVIEPMDLSDLLF